MSSRLPERQITELIDEIVGTLPAQDRQAFALTREVILPRVFAGGDLGALMEAPSGLFEFGQSEALETMKFIGTVLGTVKTAHDLLKLYQKGKPAADARQEVEEWWRRELVGAGLDDQTALAITARFSEKFEKILR